jgi:hypothetical protein
MSRRPLSQPSAPPPNSSVACQVPNLPPLEIREHRPQERVRPRMNPRPARLARPRDVQRAHAMRLDEFPDLPRGRVEMLVIPA